MLYDYLITQFYPNIIWIVFTSVVVVALAFGIYLTAKPSYGTHNQDDINKYHKKYAKYLIMFVFTHVCLWSFLFWLPDVQYIKHYYGDVRELTPAQQEELNKRLEEHYDTSKQLFLACLDKGQKQPHTTTFNDTNEVVKTCYKVARVKF